MCRMEAGVILPIIRLSFTENIFIQYKVPFPAKNSPDVLEISARFGNFVGDVVNLTWFISIIFSAGLTASVFILFAPVFCSWTGVGAARVFGAHN